MQPPPRVHRDTFAASSPGAPSGITWEARIQTSRNTVDLRGLTVREAMDALRMQLDTRPRGAVIFVIHGLGSGKVKQAVLELLKKSPAVFKYEQENVMNPGCTVAMIQ